MAAAQPDGTCDDQVDEYALWRGAFLAEASRPYLKAGPGLFAYFFARCKLRADPIYRALLERGLLAGRARILDLGCGQGLLIAWLRAATRMHESARWPKGWPLPPRPTSFRGIELMSRDVTRAHQALGANVGIETGDIREADFLTADVVVILDVLHYLDADAQRQVLHRVRSALAVGGELLLRVGDAGAGWRHRYSQWVDQTVMVLRGHSRQLPHCRNIAEWQSLLRDCAFESEAAPMSHGTPFANVLLIARAV